MDEGLKENVGKASDEVAKSVETKLKGAFGKVGESLKSVGSMTKGSFGQLGAEFKQMVSNIGSSIGGTKVGQVFSSITDGARSAASKAAGVFKGIGSTIGGALSVEQPPEIRPSFSFVLAWCVALSWPSAKR